MILPVLVTLEGKLLSFLSLAFEGLDLALKTINHSLQSLMILPVLVTLEGKLLQVTVLLANSLGSLGMTTLFIVKFNLKLTYTCFQFLDHPLATFEVRCLSLINAHLDLLQLALK